MAKATHTGNCQICNRDQKLPNGFLSKHGYTVNFGFFNGTCSGADKLPFEQSCEWLKSEIERAEQYAIEEAARIEIFKNKDLSKIDTIKDSVYVKKYWKRVMVDMKLTVEMIKYNEKYSAPGVFGTYEIDGESFKKEINTYGTDQQTVLYHVSKQHREQVSGKIGTLSRLKDWIHSANERVASWELKELTPV